MPLASRLQGLVPRRGAGRFALDLADDLAEPDERPVEARVEPAREDRALVPLRVPRFEVVRLVAMPHTVAALPLPPHQHQW
jgi:hypothetical protein